MKKLLALNILILSTTALSAEAITEPLSLSPLEQHLYEISAHPAPKQQSDSRFSRAEMRKLTTRDALKKFFWTVTVPANKELLASHPELAVYEKVNQSITNMVPSTARIFDNTNITVINTDTVTAVMSLISDKTDTPAILNLANKTVPGGGVADGSTAQEEDLCRTTTLYTSLTAAEDARMYPLGTFEALYSPEVFAHEQLDVGSFAAITMAGYRATQGRVDTKDYPGPGDAFLNGMKSKIRVIIDTAIAKGHVDIVLGTIGCGAFAKDEKGNTIVHIAPDVAQAFAEVLAEKHPTTKTERFKHFRNIQFAILENPKDTRLANTFIPALKSVGFPVQYTPAVADHQKPHVSDESAPQLMLDEDGLQEILSKMINAQFFKLLGVEVRPTSETKRWVEYKAPWPIKIASCKLNELGFYEMIAYVAHQDKNNDWYTTKVEISFANGTLSDAAKNWLQKRRLI